MKSLEARKSLKYDFGFTFSITVNQYVPFFENDHYCVLGCLTFKERKIRFRNKDSNKSSPFKV